MARAQRPECNVEQVECEAYVHRVTLAGYGQSLIHIPNGAMFGKDRRLAAIQMAALKRAGLRVGCSDYLLAVPRGTFHGLWLEMKRRQGPGPTTEQLQFGADMQAQGYAWVWARGWEQAWEMSEQYVKGLM